MREVVRSRFPLAMSAAVISGIVFLMFGGGGEVRVLPEIKATLNPSGVFMLLALVVVVVAALRGRHIIEALIYGNVTAGLAGICAGTLKPGDIFGIPAKAGGSTGIIQSGIDGVVGAVIFAILILAVTQILVECGIMGKILEFARKSVVATVRQAELFIVGVTILASILISANAPAELLVGPSLVRPMGENSAWRRRGAPISWIARCARSSSSCPGISPWQPWYGALYSAAESYGIAAPPISAALYNPYSWALLAVLLFSVLTGWNRRFAESGENGEAA